MKKIFVVFLIIILSNCTKKRDIDQNIVNYENEIQKVNVHETQEKMYVNSPEGLRVRDIPSIDGKNRYFKQLD